MIAAGQPCPQCHSKNPSDAAYCWQCYRPLTQSARQAVGGGPAGSVAVPGMPAVAYSTPIGSPLHPAGEETTLETSSVRSPLPWGKVALVVAIALVVAVGAKTLLTGGSDSHLQVPEAIGAMQRIDSPELAVQVQNIERVAAEQGTTGKAAYYGFAGVPSFFFAAIEHEPGLGETPEGIFKDFASGFAPPGSRSFIDVKSRKSYTVGDATFVCARIKGAPTGSLCMWTDQQVVGAVVTFGQTIRQTHDLTAYVRTSVET